MSVRVDQLVPYGYTDTAISTFHAFGDRLVREFALELGLPIDVRVLSPGRGRRLPAGAPVRARARSVPAARRPDPLPASARDALLSRCKDEDVSPARYLELAERRVAEARASAAASCAAAGERRHGRRARGRRCRDRGGRPGRSSSPVRTGATRSSSAGPATSTSATRSSLALRLLRESAAVRRRVQARFRYILVDEFQDTNRAQSELVALLAKGHGNVTVVGDDDQSIYRFRGAAISNILGFQERYPRARLVVLRRNYRSRAPILDAAYRLIRHNDPDRLEVRAGIVKRLRSERPLGGRGARPRRGVRHRIGRGRLDRRRDRPAHRCRGRAPRPRRARPDERRRRPDRAGVQRRRDPVAVLGHVGPVRPAGDPAAARRAAGDRRPRLERRTCTPWPRPRSTDSAART